jgi:hypothetical protein
MPSFETHFENSVGVVAKALLKKKGIKPGSPEAKKEMEDPGFMAELLQILASRAFLQRIREAEEMPEKIKDMLTDDGYDFHKLVNDGLGLGITLDDPTDIEIIKGILRSIELKEQEERQAAQEEAKRRQEELERLADLEPRHHHHGERYAAAEFTRAMLKPAPTLTASSLLSEIEYIAAHSETLKILKSKIGLDPLYNGVKCQETHKEPKELMIFVKALDKMGNSIESMIRHTFSKGQAEVSITNPTPDVIRIFAQTHGDHQKSFGPLSLSFCNDADKALEVGAIVRREGFKIDLDPKDREAIDNSEQLRNSQDYKDFTKPSVAALDIKKNFPISGQG